MFIKETNLPIQHQFRHPRCEETESLTPPPPPVRRESHFQRHASSSPLATTAINPSSSSSSSTHISFTHKTLDLLVPDSLPLPLNIPPHLTQIEVSPATSVETFRADLATQEGSVILPSTDQDPYDPLISGEFVLIRQTIDDSHTPRVQEDTEMLVPVPLHGTGNIPAPLIGPGVCRITTESRQQALLDGHFRLRRMPVKSNRRKVGDKEEGQEHEIMPPEPPKRTTSLLHSGSNSTLASIGEKYQEKSVT